MTNNNNNNDDKDEASFLDLYVSRYGNELMNCHELNEPEKNQDIGLNLEDSKKYKANVEGECIKLNGSLGDLPEQPKIPFVERLKVAQENLKENKKYFGNEYVDLSGSLGYLSPSEDSPLVKKIKKTYRQPFEKTKENKL